MQSAKEKLSNMASAAKEHANIYKAKGEEKAEEAFAGSKEEKEMAHERRKAKEAEAKMEMHAAKSDHKAEKLDGQHYGHHVPLLRGHGRHPVGTAAPMAGATTPTEKYL